jgi:hypothetical protein
VGKSTRWQDSTYSLIFDANVLLTLECHEAELEEVGIQAQVRELEHFSEVEREALVLHCIFVCSV